MQISLKERDSIADIRLYKYIFTRKLQVDKILNEKSVSLVCSVHHYKTGEDAHRPFDF